jgi:hypothetical protein
MKQCSRRNRAKASNFAELIYIMNESIYMISWLFLLSYYTTI